MVKNLIKEAGNHMKTRKREKDATEIKEKHKENSQSKLLEWKDRKLEEVT